MHSQKSTMFTNIYTFPLKNGCKEVFSIQPLWNYLKIHQHASSKLQYEEYDILL